MCRIYPSGRSSLFMLSNCHPINLKQPYYFCSAGLRSNLLLNVDKEMVSLGLSSFPSLLLLQYAPFFSANNYPLLFLSIFIISVHYTRWSIHRLLSAQLLRSTNNLPIKTTPQRNNAKIEYAVEVDEDPVWRRGRERPRRRLS